MEELKVFCREKCRGEATVERKDGRSEIAVSMEDPADGLYRAVLVGERGQLPLGVMEPHHGTLVLRRRPYLRDVEKLGMLRSIQVSRSFAFRRGETWKRTDRPMDLFKSSFLRDRLVRYKTAWWKKRENTLLLALPLDEDAPFPLETMFCLARIEVVDDRRCVVYTFDRQEGPI